MLRANAGIFYGRVPGPDPRVVALDERQPRAVDLPQQPGRAVPRSGLPAYPNLIPQSQIGAPFIRTSSSSTRTSRTRARRRPASRGSRSSIPDYAFLVKYNYAKGEHITRFVNRNDPLLGSPWSHRPRRGRRERHRRADDGRVHGARASISGSTLGVTSGRRTTCSSRLYYTYSKDKSDDDNERDPFTFRYAKITDLDAEYGYSDRDQRHRVNAWLLWNAPMGVDVNVALLLSLGAAAVALVRRQRAFCGRTLRQSRFIADAQTPQDRINPDGSVTQRNLGRKDNQYSSLDLRLSKQFRFGGHDRSSRRSTSSISSTARTSAAPK